MIIPPFSYLIPSKRDVRLCVLFDENPTVSSTLYDSSNERVITPAVGKLWQKPTEYPSGATDSKDVFPYHMNSASEIVKCNVCIPSTRIHHVLVNPLSPFKQSFVNVMSSVYDVPCMTWKNSSNNKNGTGFIMSTAQDLFGTDRLFGDTSFCLRLLYKTSVNSVTTVNGQYELFGFGNYFQWLAGTTQSIIIYDNNSGWKSKIVTHKRFDTGWVAIQVVYDSKTKTVVFYAHGNLVATFYIDNFHKMNITDMVESFYFNKNNSDNGDEVSIADINIWAGEFDTKDTYVIETAGVSM